MKWPGPPRFAQKEVDNVDEVCEIIGADSLAFLSVESLYKAARRNGMCAACFDGKYPTELYSIRKDEE